MSIELRPHQLEGVANMHNGCILYGDVGVGKTITSLAYYFTKVCGGEINKWGSMQTPKDVYVITTAKVRDSKGFEVQAAAFGVHSNPNVSTNGVKITVDSWNNLHKYVEVKDAFFIFDEQRVVGYGAWSRAFIKVAKHNEWILLSATPGDTWLDYIPVFIANGWYKHKTDFLDQHVIWTPRVKYPKVLRYQDVGKLVRSRNAVLVHMPYERHTTRHPRTIEVSYDEQLFEKAVKKRWHVYENRPLRDVSELFSVMRKVVNSDTSRLEAVSSLLQKHPKLIVFYNFDYELEMLRTLGPNGSLSTDPKTSSSMTQRLGSEPTPSSNQSSTQSGLTQRKSSSSSGSSVPSTAKLSGEGSSISSDYSMLLKEQAYLDQKDPMYGTRWAESWSPTSIESGSTGVTPITRPRSSSKRKSSSSSSLGGSTFDSTKSSGCGSGTSSSFAIAEWNGHKHQEIPKTDSWLYLVQYRAGSEGWNCVETDAICFYSQTYSYRDWWQAHGRIDRLNTPFTDLYYYYLVSRSMIDKAIRAALKAKKSFNERSLGLE